MYVRDALLLSAAAVAPVMAGTPTMNLYWGQSGVESLASFCDSDGFEYVTVSFLSASPESDPDTNYPTSNFGAHCAADVYTVGGKNSRLLSACTYIQQDIAYCKSKGKKVLLSVGGVYGSDPAHKYDVSTEANGEYFAEFLWKAFGPYDSTWNGPRPFDISSTVHNELDGFDFDIEIKFDDQTGYVALINKLHEYIDGAGGSQVITGAPQCPLADEWFQMKYMIQNAKFDKLWIQFYNNPGCDATTSSFNFADWYEFLSGTASQDALLYIGLPADSSINGYISNTDVNTIVDKYKDKPYFGGVMLWDASLGLGNKVGSKTYYEAIHDYMCAPAQTTTTSSTTSSTSTSSSTYSTSSTSSVVYTTTTSTVYPSTTTFAYYNTSSSTSNTAPASTSTYSTSSYYSTSSTAPVYTSSTSKWYYANSSTSTYGVTSSSYAVSSSLPSYPTTTSSYYDPGYPVSSKHHGGYPASSKYPVYPVSSYDPAYSTSTCTDEASATIPVDHHHHHGHGGYPAYTTSTYMATTTYTVTACPAYPTEYCHVGDVTSSVYATTTVCPYEEAHHEHPTKPTPYPHYPVAGGEDTYPTPAAKVPVYPTTPEEEDDCTTTTTGTWTVFSTIVVPKKSYSSSSSSPVAEYPVPTSYPVVATTYPPRPVGTAPSYNGATPVPVNTATYPATYPVGTGAAKPCSGHSCEKVVTAGAARSGFVALPALLAAAAAFLVL